MNINDVENDDSIKPIPPNEQQLKSMEERKLVEKSNQELIESLFSINNSQKKDSLDANHTFNKKVQNNTK
jgi:hypothetical protein